MAGNHKYTGICKIQFFMGLIHANGKRWLEYENKQTTSEAVILYKAFINKINKK